MTGETHHIPLSSWRPEIVRPTVLAYRSALAAGKWEAEASEEARNAFLAAGGDPEAAPSLVPLIVSAAARDHGEWFWRPMRERVEREERYWRSRGIWPPPKNRKDWPDPLPE